MEKSLFEILQNYQSASENSVEQLNDISVIGIGEDDFSDADSFDSFVEDDNSTADYGSGDMGADFGNDYSDTESGENIPKDALEFLENIDESEEPLVQKMIDNFGALYSEQASIYEKLLLENLDTTDFSDNVRELKKQYETTLELLKSYLMNKLPKETTAVRVETFIRFKQTFQNLGDALNLIMENVE